MNKVPALIDDLISMQELKDFLKYDHDYFDSYINGIRIASIGRVLQHIKGTDISRLDDRDVWAIKNAILLLCCYIDSGRISSGPNNSAGFLPYEVEVMLLPWHKIGCA